MCMCTHTHTHTHTHSRGILIIHVATVPIAAPDLSTRGTGHG